MLPQAAKNVSSASSPTTAPAANMGGLYQMMGRLRPPLGKHDWVRRQALGTPPESSSSRVPVDPEDASAPTDKGHTLRGAVKGRLTLRNDAQDHWLRRATSCVQ
ncbi:hypothetical protein GCM10020220_103220 [Nonomuraea rubra]